MTFERYLVPLTVFGSSANSLARSVLATEMRGLKAKAGCCAFNELTLVQLAGPN
jgi:hypothetical protein